MFFEIRFGNALIDTTIYDNIEIYDRTDEVYLQKYQNDWDDYFIGYNEDLNVPVHGLTLYLEIQTTSSFKIKQDSPDMPALNYGTDSWDKTISAKNWVFQEDGSVRFEITFSNSDVTPKYVNYKEEYTVYDGLCFILEPINTPTVEGIPYITAYKPTFEQVESIKDFIYNEDNEDKKEVIKSSIMGMYIIPFALENENEETTIFLDKYSTGILSKPINEKTLSFDLGTIFIEDFSFDSSIGHKNILLQLITPYFPIIELDTNECLNSTIAMNYVVDILGGKATLNVINVKTNMIISSTQKTLSLNIPYIIDNVAKNNEFQNVLYNNINKCYVKVLVQVPRNSKTIETPDKIAIGNGKQLLKIDNPLLETKATKEEQEEIKTLLRNGVII